MGQRHQYIIVYPEMNIGEGNGNNKPGRAHVIHHQWLFGRSAIFAADRSVRLITNMISSGDDYHFGTDSNGYASGSGTDAIAAAISVDPDQGYYHGVRVWDKNYRTKEETDFFDTKTLEPDDFDNNDGITLIVFKRGEKKPGLCFLTPGHLEGKHWKPTDGRGPWGALEYLSFYYNASEMGEWPAEVQAAIGLALNRINEGTFDIAIDEVRALLPKFDL